MLALNLQGGVSDRESHEAISRFDEVDLRHQGTGFIGHVEIGGIRTVQSFRPRLGIAMYPCHDDTFHSDIVRLRHPNEVADGDRTSNCRCTDLSHQRSASAMTCRTIVDVA
ncbi:hypothetical protein DI458_04610 [Burkholderia contaminans]|nr:hypothetical protein [Burkholderia contaminans]RBQ63566.1 hypothetical protein DI458_04610 [Burkholderia contaminans]HBN6128791.1 hypothetical protein [Clostridioides difficile]